jgi:hypothetical protein
MKAHRIFINQYDRIYSARTLKELREQIPGRVSLMYIDDKASKSYHIGYVIGREWLTEYKSVIKEAGEITYSNPCIKPYV